MRKFRHGIMGVLVTHANRIYVFAASVKIGKVKL